MISVDVTGLSLITKRPNAIEPQTNIPQHNESLIAWLWKLPFSKNEEKLNSLKIMTLYSMSAVRSFLTEDF